MKNEGEGLEARAVCVDDGLHESLGPLECLLIVFESVRVCDVNGGGGSGLSVRTIQPR